MQCMQMYAKNMKISINYMSIDTGIISVKVYVTSWDNICNQWKIKSNIPKQMLTKGFVEHNLVREEIFSLYHFC